MTNGRLLPVAVLLLLAVPLLGDTFPTGGPRSTNNDDSCDVAALPAATLLLPYFEVDLDDFEGETTLFTVTNTGDRAQVVRTTLWTDYGYPVISFNIYLTGYDVQSINLRDILASGRIGGDDGTGTSVSPVGELSRGAGSGHDVTNCTRIPHLTPEDVTLLQSAFTIGRYTFARPNDVVCPVGNTHVNAIGYATMDVVARCSDALPTDNEYFTEEIRYDNVLMGEYQQINPANNFAQGGTLVHIRAIPEGGTQATRNAPMLASNFPRTFYRRLLDGDTLSDARQPLPSAFMARWINGTGAGFQTSFKFWRELSGRDASTCGVDDDYTTVTEIVVFDEAENAFAQARPPLGDPPRPDEPANLPAASLVNIGDDDIFPRPPNGASAGWVYINLDSRDADATYAEQAWAISSMRAEGRYSADFDATAFGNGCSPRIPKSEINAPGSPIGPPSNVTP
ncbi:MAG TPA: hypothetical protein VGD79_12335 [Thermoanaerobaculia bacterium]|jgi:hypothetical protein